MTEFGVLFLSKTLYCSLIILFYFENLSVDVVTWFICVVIIILSRKARGERDFPREIPSSIIDRMDSRDERSTIDLRRDGEIVTDLTGKMHQLPCCIKYNGPTSVSHYFKPKASGGILYTLMHWAQHLPCFPIWDWMTCRNGGGWSKSGRGVF